MAPALGAISPHLDDLALSCGRFLAAHPGSSLVTVFAGGPPAVDPLTGWESLSGCFEPGADVVGARRREDAEAAEMLRCDHRHLEHWDDQYRHAAYGYDGPIGEELVGRVAADIEALVAASTFATWLVPLGIGHPDHVITASACLTVAGRLPDREWLVYEELPYATNPSRQLDEATDRLGARGFHLEPALDIGPAGSGPAKLDVVGCYRSQLGPLGRGVSAALGTAERLHRLSRPG